MLIELRIRNVAVIESVTLPLAAGLNVLTGETGAGKSLIVGALSFLLGERSAADRVRHGADKASVEGVFDAVSSRALKELLDSRGIDTDDEHIVLKREVTSAGRSRAWVNGTTVTAGFLAEVGEHLVNVHGQHDARLLLDRSLQRDILDGYASATETAARVRSLFAEHRQLAARERDILQRRAEAERRADFLRFQLQEIDAVQLQEGEAEHLDSDVRRLAHAEELQGQAASASDMLNGDEQSIVSQLAHVRRAITTLSRIDPDAGRFLASVEENVVSLSELARDLESYAEGIDADPQRLRKLEERRSQVQALLRKYGPTVSDVDAAAADARAQLALVDNASADLEAVAAERTRVRETHVAASRELSAKRKKAAKSLARDVTALLPDLGMEHGAFVVELQPLNEPDAHGGEDVWFKADLNAGSEPRTLDRIASGGELSRLMLALSTVLARHQHVPTLVFDEIDAGIGGAVAWDVGALMRRVSAHHQVLAISHLAQIAAQADHHVVVRKNAVGQVTTADTAVVSGDSRVVEVARMLSGDEARDVSRAHARELLARGVA